MEEKIKCIKDILNSCSKSELKELNTYLQAFLSGVEPSEISNFDSDKLRPVKCEKCGSEKIIKHGISSNGSPRYICKNCKKTITVSKNTRIRYSKLTNDEWHDYLEGLILNLSIPLLSKKTGISKTNCWVNKIKVCMAIYEKYGEQVQEFKGTVQADEFYAPVSFKGKKDPRFFIYTLGRMPRHHRSMEERIEYLQKNDLYDELRINDPDFLEDLISGESEKKYKGISRDQTCILTCMDTKESLYVKPVCVGAIATKHLKELRGKFKEANVLVTDGEDSYRSLAKSENLLHEQVLADKHVKGNFNLGDINGLHSKLNKFWNAKDGRSPSTKYMDIEIMLFWWLEQNKDLSLEEQIRKLYNLLVEVYGKTTVDYKEISKHKMSLDTKGYFPKEV